MIDLSNNDHNHQYIFHNQKNETNKNPLQSAPTRLQPKTQFLNFKYNP